MNDNQLKRAKTTSWHSLEAAAVLDQLVSSRDGLCADEAQRRLGVYGANELTAKSSRSAWRLLVAQFKNILILLLLVASLLSALLGHSLEAGVIAILVLFAICLGFFQEYRAENALASLRKLAAPTARLIREGKELTLPARLLVPGDIVVLRAGDRIPADARLLEAANLALDESALTGESMVVEKSEALKLASDLPLGERCNMVFAGTIATTGRGSGIVVATGMETEFGAISQMVASVETRATPLQENLDHLGRILGQAALFVVLIIVTFGWWRGSPLLEMVIFGIALAVAVVPEALPAVVTISLSIGVRRMVRRNALVRHLPVVETLGSTSVICSDKTGTLTQNEMTLRQIALPDAQCTLSGVGYDPCGQIHCEPEGMDLAVSELLKAAVLCSDARVFEGENGHWKVEGDPTEGALIVAALKAGLDPEALNRELPRNGELGFTSERRRMTTFHDAGNGRQLICSKGAVETILPDCSTMRHAGGDRPINADQRASLYQREQELAAKGLRILAFAQKLADEPHATEQEMTWLGMVGMMDPPRSGAQAAVETCRLAGIQSVMVTGDHPLTARAIAEEIGLLQGRRVVSGQELAQMSDADLLRDIPQIGVFARLSPADKLRIVSAWQNHGHVVAMTGDGVNDAPSLKRADVGLAMGLTGTDVCKEASAVTLLDDNFSTIVAAIEEGRIIFSNIQKYLSYLLSSNLGEILLMAGAIMFGFPLPLTAVQLLYVNLATDGLPALALAVDPPETDLMRSPPRNPRTGVFSRPLVFLMVSGGVWSALVNIGLFAILQARGHTLEQAMGMTFISLVAIQFIKAYCFRSQFTSVFHKPFANRWLNLAIVWELLMLLIIVYFPPFQKAFGTFDLNLVDWAYAIGPAISILFVLEAVKRLIRR